MIAPTIPEQLEVLREAANVYLNRVPADSPGLTPKRRAEVLTYVADRIEVFANKAAAPRRRGARLTAPTQGEARICTLEIADGDCVVMIGDRQILECYEDGEVQTDEDRANAQRVVKTWNAYEKLIVSLRNARAAFTSAHLRGQEIINQAKRGSREALAGAEMQKYARDGQKDIDARLLELGETS